MCRACRVFELLAKRSEGCRILVVPVHIPQKANEFFESGRIKPAVFLQTVFCASAKLIKIPSCFSHADHGDVEVPTLYHRLQRRENLFVGKIAGGAEENERIRVKTGHEYLSFRQPQTCLSAFPNVRRIQNAWRTEDCTQSRLRRVSSNARTARRSAPGSDPLRQLQL